MLNSYPLPIGLNYHTLTEQPFALQSSKQLPKVEIAYTTLGTRAEDDSNVVLVLHALSGSSDCAAWWPGLIGKGKLIDPSRDFVLCANFLGSCYGSTGPEDILFPEITIRDIARTQLLLLQELGIRKLRLAIGGSMGAMVLLELALLNQEAGSPISIELIVPIATGADHSAWRVAFSSTIRKTIELLGKSEAAGGYEEGLRLARQIAMISYRSKQEFDGRFGRQRKDEQFEVESYLEHHGAKIVDRFSPFAYRTLTKAMELFDITESRSGSLADILARIDYQALFIGISSDILYTEAEIKLVAALLPLGSYVTLEAPYGHDSFLISDGETEVKLTRLIKDFLRDSASPVSSDDSSTSDLRYAH